MPTSSKKPTNKRERTVIADSTVKVNFIGDSSRLKKAVDESDSHLGRLASGIGDIAKKAAIGFAAVGAGVAVFAKSAISAASDLAESQGKVNVVFGNNAKAIEKWAEGSAKAIGQSKQQALEAVGTYGNLFKAFGLGDKETVAMSTSLVDLASDLASFNNTTVDDALLALRSGLSGEAEPLKKFGVALTDDRLKLEAFSLGLIKNTKQAMTPAIKAQASYALIMKDTALAQGDFARTSDGLANKTRILKARFADIQAEIGTKLLPIVTSLAGVLLDKVFPVFEKVGGAAGKFFSNLFGEGVGEGSTDKALSWSATVRRVLEEDVLPAFKAVFGWVKENVPPVLQAIGKFIREDVVPAIQSLVQWVRDDLGPALGKMGAAFREDIWPVLKEKVLPALKDLAVFVKDEVLPILGKIVIFIIEKLIPAFFKVVEWIATVLIPKIAEITVRFWNFVIDVKEVVEDVGDAFSKIAQAIWHPFDVAFGKIKEFYDTYISPIIGAIMGFGNLWGLTGGTAGPGSTQFGSGPGGGTIFGGGGGGGGGGGFASAGLSLAPPVATTNGGGGGTQVINLQMDGRTWWSWMIDDSRNSGGIPLTLRPPS